MILETIVTTLDSDGRAHIRPLGVTLRGEYLVLAPFTPSRTQDNLRVRRSAVINYTTDVRVFAGTLTGRHQWPVVAARKIDGVRLRDTLAHKEVEVVEIEDDSIRPRFVCRTVFAESHAPYSGFNRAQAAVLEAAILVSRLNRLPVEKVDAELAYLRISLEKTAGPLEREAWEWLMEAVDAYRRGQACVT
ncbi:MAG: DUF447 domain-containing protein [Thioalkalivibrio sp.]